MLRFVRIAWRGLTLKLYSPVLRLRALQRRYVGEGSSASWVALEQCDCGASCFCVTVLFCMPRSLAHIERSLSCELESIGFGVDA